MKRQTQIAQELGQRLKSARLANSLTLTQLAGRAGLSEAFLSRLERAQAAASVANLIQITDALGIGMHDLFARDTRVQKTAVAVHRAKERRRPLSRRKAIAGSGWAGAHRAIIWARSC